MPRPKKTLAVLPEDWKTKLLSEMSEGASLQEIKGMFRISNDLHARWMKEEKEYSEAIKTGELYSEAWWMKMGRKNLTTKEFSPTLWYMNMKNRFGWKDNQHHEHTGKDGDPIETMNSIVYIPKQLPDDYYSKTQTK